MSKLLVAALYKFARLEDYQDLQVSLRERCERAGVKGTLLLAREGINGTIAGPEEGIRAVLAGLRADPRLAELDHKESWTDEQPFLRLKVRLKKEIVSMGVPSVDPTCVVGTYVEPRDWNALISQPDVVVVDTRNDYEVEIGSFRGAIQPETTTFRQFPEWARSAEALQGARRVAMFCTGGIRCEKASSFLVSEGVDEVYHLKGGILRYLEEVPAEESLWDGECFVFDGRVSVDHSLQPGEYGQCFACRRPVSEEDQRSPRYEQGVSCPRCFDQLTDDQRERFSQRELQIQLAKERGEVHIGVNPRPASNREKTSTP